MVFAREVIGLRFGNCEGVRSSAGNVIQPDAGIVNGTERIGDAVGRERRRIARELHDVIGHRLVVIMMTARRMEVDRDDGATHARSIEETSRDAMGELRRILGLLRRTSTVGLDREIVTGTSDAVAEIVELFTRVNPGGGLHFENAELERTLPAGVRHTTVRVVQEGLTNALKYGTGSVDVTVSFGVQVRITMINEVAAHRQVAAGDRVDGGLRGLEERVAEQGGSFGYGSRDDRRFFIEAILPAGPEDLSALRGERSWMRSRS
ncbi:sensor histidine kinase [Microlunatus sp. GCM10028923]|uniref:sensor histidine kinase n=1 Tax=Microlunatus sp. GCM10028923 TaxID=3273400 RepID=UPI0036160A0D